MKILYHSHSYFFNPQLHLQVNPSKLLSSEKVAVASVESVMENHYTNIANTHYICIYKNYRHVNTVHTGIYVYIMGVTILEHQTFQIKEKLNWLVLVSKHFSNVRCSSWSMFHHFTMFNLTPRIHIYSSSSFLSIEDV